MCWWSIMWSGRRRTDLLQLGLNLRIRHFSRFGEAMEALTQEGRGRTITRSVHPTRQSAAAAALLLAACFALAASIYAQGKPAAVSTVMSNSPAFEVATVKPAKPDCNFTTSGGTQGRYVGRCMTLWGLIFTAYEVRSYQIIPRGCLPGR